MNILIIGDETNFKECQQKFGETHSYQLKPNHLEAESVFTDYDAIFDFCIDRDPSQMKVYCDHAGVAFLNTTKISLTKLASSVNQEFKCSLFGFAGLPTFLDRAILETTLYKEDQKSKLEEICKKLNTDFELVKDQVGLVTPRVICMIINEAYYTVEDGIATREDIDLAMKLGTNYPHGPFEWAQRIGIRNVYEVLDAVSADTKDERYMICPTLKEEGLLHRN